LKDQQRVTVRVRLLLRRAEYGATAELMRVRFWGLFATFQRGVLRIARLIQGKIGDLGIGLC
jgi:hypothetical protein